MGERHTVLDDEYEAPRVEDLGEIGEPIDEMEVFLPESLLERLPANV